MIRQVITAEGQTVYDLALQYLGTPEGIYEIIPYNTGMSAESVYSANVSININFGGVFNERNVQRVKEKKFIFVSAIVANQLKGSYLLQENTFPILQENNGLIEL